MRTRATNSPAAHRVSAVLETIKGLLLQYGAHNFVAQQLPDAPLIAFARPEEVTF